MDIGRRKPKRKKSKERRDRTYPVNCSLFMNPALKLDPLRDAIPFIYIYIYLSCDTMKEKRDQTFA